MFDKMSTKQLTETVCCLQMELPNENIQIVGSQACKNFLTPVEHQDGVRKYIKLAQAELAEREPVVQNYRPLVGVN